MFGRIKRKDYGPEVIPTMQGSFDGLKVTMHNFPCLREPVSEARTFAFPDFGRKLIDAVVKDLGQFDELQKVLNGGAGKTVVMKLHDLAPFEVSVAGKCSDSDRQFQSDLGDALIAAFESKSIKP